MRANSYASPDEIDISSLWSVMKRNATRIVATSAVLGLGTLGVLMLIPSKYASEAQIQIGGPGINNPFNDPKSGTNQSNADPILIRVDKEAIASQVVALQSRDLANKLALELKLNMRPEFNSELSSGLLSSILHMTGISGPRPGETEEERVLAAYVKALRVYQTKETRVINIEFSSNDSELAALAANRLTELYQDQLRVQAVDPTLAAEKWLKPAVAKAEREAAEADAEVESFRKNTDIFKGSSNQANSLTGLDEQRLTELTTEVTKVQAARSDAESRARTARELMQRGSVDAIPEVQKSPVIQALIAQRTRAEREKAEAETSLLPGHPRMKQVNANVTDLRRQVTKEATAIVDGVEREAKGLALREELAAKSLSDMKARVGNKSGDNVKLAALESKAKAKRRELESLQDKYEKSRNYGNTQAVAIEAQIISKARPSSVPASPKRALLASMASFAGLLLGFAFVIFKELFSGSRRGGAQQPAAYPSEPAFVAAATANLAPARVVRQTANGAAARTQAAPVAMSVTPSASVDAIARRLVGNAGGQGGYRTVITGGACGVIAHEEAADLAGALSAAGKQVALVDWSFDGRGLSEGFGLSPAPGLMDLLDGRASFEDVIRRLPEGDVHIVPCGAAQSGVKALNPDRINLVLDALDEAYDHIVVTGEIGQIRDLFLAIQGRFDAGVVVNDPSQPTPANEIGDGVFLGFQVTDIDVLRIDRADGGAANRRKMQLARNGANPEARY